MAVNKVTDSSFDSDVLKASLPVLVDFYADWCGPCKMAEPVLVELSESYKDKVIIVKLNVDESSQTAGKYGVMSIPTTILFKGGNEIGRQVGFGGKQVFEELIKKGGDFLMQDSTIAQPTTDQPVAQPVTSTMPAADVTMTPVPEVDVNATVTETPAMTTEAVVTETPAQVAGPAPVEVPAEIKVDLPEVPAQVAPVTTETPVTPTV